VPIKSAEQLDLQALHRIRSRLVGHRTAVINQLRSFLLECGVIVPQGPARLREILPSVLAQRTDVLSPRMIRLIEELAEDWRRLDDRVDAVTSEVHALARQDECCRRLTSIPGIGALTASAVVATIGNGAAFSKGRDFGAWLGLVPKQLSTGDRTILGRLSKRGNKYMRTLFIIGARAVLAKPGSWAKFGLQGWLAAAAKRLHHNVLAAALAQQTRAHCMERALPRPFLRARLRATVSLVTPHAFKSCGKTYPGLRGDLKRMAQRSPQRT